MVIDFSAQNLFFVVGTVATLVLTVLFVVVLWRLARILGRVDKLSEDIESCVGDVSHFLKELRKRAIVSSIALVIEKFINAKKSKK